MKRNHSGGGFFMGAIVGGVLATMTAMLFGTKQGKKVKHDAVVKYRGAVKKYHDVVDKYDIEGMAKKMLHKGKKKSARHKHK